MLHRLKTWREPFSAIFRGLKRHEFRREDGRTFCVGDILILQEFEHCETCKATGEIRSKRGIEVCPSCIGEKGSYTGRELRCEVTYVTRPPDYGMQPGFVVMSIKLAGDKFIEHQEEEE